MRLSAITGQHQQLTILGLDQPLMLAEQMGIVLENDAGRAQLESALLEIVAAYTPLVTGVLLSPELGYAAIPKISSGAGLLFCLEKTLTESDPLSIPILQNNWNIEYVRNNYAMAKLALFARSDEAELITKLELVNELYDSCRYEGIDYMLEILVTDGRRLGTEAFQEQQLRLIRLFRQQSDIAALEYPRTALGCLTATAQLGAPWIMVESEKTEYSEAKEELRNALAGGALGLLIRNSVFPSFKRGEFSMEGLRSYLKQEGRDRLLELARICEESVGVG
ncbi:hypothetical protein KA012_04605 [Candidatus Woesebacteria bacterium]|nr:hypothetical protein [Candidatus Woesebacteria bacterium]